MQKACVTRYPPDTRSSGVRTVVYLSDYKRISHRFGRFLKRRKFSWIWTSIAVVLFSTMSLGAISESSILKHVAWLSFGIAFFLIAPFSWWLSGASHR